MAHTHQDKKKTLTRINRLKGQLDSVAKLVESEADCYKVIQVLASARGALNGLMGELVDGHIATHIVEAKSKDDASKAGREVTEILKSFWR
jgi:DNA-binding FrmR family transcriptional regulator